MPFSKSGDTQSGPYLENMFRIMIRWTESLHGDGLLRESLMGFADLAQAEVVRLYRLQTKTATQSAIATFDRSAANGARPLTRSHGLALAGQTRSRAKPGTLWFMRDLDRDAARMLDPRVLDWMESRGQRDAMVIPFSATEAECDILEFYVPVPLDPARRMALERLAPAAAEAWGRRPEGRIARLLRAAPMINDRLGMTGQRVHALSASNPLGLTAAELRICNKIRQGKDVGATSESLGITDSTLRSHLRNIYAKAGVAGQVGLLRVLLEPETTPRAIRA